MHLSKSIIGVLAWFVSFTILAACPEDSPSLEEFRKMPGAEVKGPFSVATLERENMALIQESGKRIPFGRSSEQWQALKAAMKPGDQIYFISRSQDRFYIDGHILVSGGCFVYFLKGAIS